MSLTAASRVLGVIVWREFAAYWRTPIAPLFSVAFVALAALAAFYLGGLYEGGQADLRPFFHYHPWLFLLLVPALTMRLWAEERRSGTIEWLLHLPVSPWQWVIGKFLAAWAMVLCVLLFTTPMWMTVSWLGLPDHGVVLAGYAASAMLAAVMVALGQVVSLLTRHQVVAFVLGVAIGCVLLLLGSEAVLESLRQWFSIGTLDRLAGFSLIERHRSLLRGVLDARDLLFFLITTFALLVAARLLVARLPQEGQ